MKKDTGRAFFEVFRRLDDTERPRSSWPKKLLSRSGKRDEPARPVQGGGRARDATPPRDRLTLALSREALAIAMFAIVVVLVASHVWGYRRGLAKRDVAAGAATRPAADSPERRVASARTGSTGSHVRPLPLDMTARRELQPPFHTLRIISGISLNSAKRIRAELLAKGYDALIYQDARYSGYTVNVGRYTTNRAPELEELRRRFLPVYRDCYPMKLDGKGKIIP